MYLNEKCYIDMCMQIILNHELEALNWYFLQTELCQRPRLVDPRIPEPFVDCHVKTFGDFRQLANCRPDQRKVQALLRLSSPQVCCKSINDTLTALRALYYIKKS